eukprot:CAMPEP_0184388104 /NCGR_PEP_ID=MMETSP0007-20130409/11315_1 /TAXON_ID=97485 /ORGANISM="Prymnesium parvum, Strain Texoma1" /LENGTH=108 /DNA_ID=CAMNT_0026736803 /DNA_START=164 /DNA_END=487 /DNA_ORIENTATION=-
MCTLHSFIHVEGGGGQEDDGLIPDPCSPRSDLGGLMTPNGGIGTRSHASLRAMMVAVAGCTSTHQIVLISPIRLMRLPSKCFEIAASSRDFVAFTRLTTAWYLGYAVW